MTKLNISPEWTNRERLMVISRISLKICHAKQNTPIRELSDYGQTINLLSGASPEFLELNREMIFRELEDEPA